MPHSGLVDSIRAATPRVRPGRSALRTLGLAALAFAGALLPAAGGLAGPLVRVLVSQFDGSEPAAVSSISNPALFQLAPEIEYAVLKAVNPAGAFKENDGPGNYLPALTPIIPGFNDEPGYILLEVTPKSGMPVKPGAVTFQPGAKFPGNPSSLRFLTSADDYSATVASIDTAVTTPWGIAVDLPTTADTFGFIWLAANDFGDFGGGQAGFSGQDIVVREACAAAPRSLCAEFAKASISMQGDPSPSRNRLSWSGKGTPPILVEGAAQPVEVFGNPVSTAGNGYDVCLYDGGGLVAQLPLAAAGTCGKKPCWKSNGKTSVRFANRAATHEGIASLALKASARGVALKLAGQGAYLDLPLPVAQLPSLSIQLVRDPVGRSVFCLQSDFQAPARTNEPDRFRDSVP
jgi:hypothetical protein